MQEERLTSAACWGTQWSGFMGLCLLSRQLVNPPGFLCLEAGAAQGEECPCHTVCGGGGGGCLSGEHVVNHKGVSPSVSLIPAPLPNMHKQGGEAFLGSTRASPDAGALEQTLQLAWDSVSSCDLERAHYPSPPCSDQVWEEMRTHAANCKVLLQ